MAPMQTKLVDKELLSKKEVQWLNDYNAKVKKTLLPLVKDDKRTVAWLEKECQPI